MPEKIDSATDLFREIIESDPELSRMVGNMAYQMAGPRLRFPGGLRYRYWGKFAMFTGIWAFCYSTTRNENKKFISYVYQPVVGKKQWKMAKLLEHRQMKDAKARALRMYQQHKAVQDKYEALFKKGQRKGRIHGKGSLGDRLQ